MYVQNEAGELDLEMRGGGAHKSGMTISIE